MGQIVKDIIFFDNKGSIIQVIENGELINLDKDETINGSIENVDLMKNDYIELHFNLSNPIIFSFERYCTYNGIDYVVSIYSTVTSQAKFVEFSQVSILETLNLIVSKDKFYFE